MVQIARVAETFHVNMDALSIEQDSIPDRGAAVNLSTRVSCEKCRHRPRLPAIRWVEWPERVACCRSRHNEVDDAYADCSRHAAMKVIRLHGRVDVRVSASLRQQTLVRNRFCRLCDASTRLRSSPFAVHFASVISVGEWVRSITAGHRAAYHDHNDGRRRSAYISPYF